MTAEPGNLSGLNSYKFSGLADEKVLGLSSVKTGNKESIILTTRNKKSSRSARPARVYVTNGLNKQAKKGLAALDKTMDAGYYRRDLLELAKVKYSKIKTSFKKRKTVVKSRRSGK